MKVAICGLLNYGHGVRDDLDALLADWQQMFPEKALANSGNELVFVKRDTVSLRTATHVLLINYGTLPAELDHVPQQNIVHMSMEPVKFLPLLQSRKHIIEKRARISIGGIKHPSLSDRRSCSSFVLVPSPSIQAVPRMLKPWGQRANISIVFSNAQTAPGHKYRHELARAIADSNLPVDFWGHGAQSLMVTRKDDSRFKGSFENVEPYVNYKFTIAIENYKEGYYFTEKVTLPIYCGCMPLYLGSPNIDEFFPGAIITLSGNVDTDLAAIKNILETAPDLEERVTGGRKYFQQKWHWGDYLKRVLDGSEPLPS